MLTASDAWILFDMNKTKFQAGPQSDKEPGCTWQARVMNAALHSFTDPGAAMERRCTLPKSLKNLVNHLKVHHCFVAAVYVPSQQ